MPIEILMPALSPTMTEGNLAKWLKKEGDKVNSGDVIAEIETDKATMEVEAVDEGVLGKILVPEGTQGVEVNKLIAVLLEEGEDKAALDNFKSIEAATPVVSGKEEAPKEAAPAPEAKPAVANAPTPAPAPAPAAALSNGKLAASPLARRVAEQSGLDLARVQGTGPHGRIVRADVEEAVARGVHQQPAMPAGGGYGRNPVESERIANSTMRKVIAKRLLESKQTVPHFYLSIDCEIDEALAMRSQMNASAPLLGEEKKPAFKITVNDFVIKAVAMALKEIPDANASWSDEAIIRYNNVDVSVAVAIDGGLITPIVKNADQKSISAISNEMKSLAARAKQGRLSPEEFQGGGFSVSNLGMYGIKSFSAIINPPQSCILAIGTSEERPVVDNGEIRIATIMNVTLSCDHRVVDGAVGAEFLAAFKRYIEQPVTMLV